MLFANNSMCHGQQIWYQLWHNHPTIIGDSKHNGFIINPYGWCCWPSPNMINTSIRIMSMSRCQHVVPRPPLGVPPLRKPSSCQFVDVVIDGSINTQPGDTDVEQLLLHTFCHFNRALRHKNVFDIFFWWDDRFWGILFSINPRLRSVPVIHIDCVT